MSASTQSRYSKGAMIFHWLIAIAVIANWRIADAAEEAAKADAGAIWSYHKALGITILLLTLGRLAWRMTHKVPPLPANYASWERIVARGMHLLFYVLLIGLPIGGWLASSYYGKGVDMFGLFTWPALPVANSPSTGEAIFELHHTGGEIMIYLIGLHILAALKHTFFDKDGGIFRMLPFGRVKG